MYNFNGNYQGCGCNNIPIYPQYNTGRSNYAIILVLFILLVIIIGARSNN